MLKFKDIRIELDFTLQEGALRMRELLRVDSRYEIDYDVFLPTKGFNLQRPFVWTLEQKQELIISLLKGVKLPYLAVVLNDGMSLNDRKVYQIIDGKQRLSTIISFVRNEFPIVWKNVEYYFNDLDNDAKHYLQVLNMPVYIAYEYPDDLIPDDWKIQWFNLINFAGTKQDRDHMNKLLGL